MSQHATTPLLKERDVRIYLAGRTVTELGSRITREGLPLVAVIAAGATAQDLGYMAAMAYVAALVMAPLAGVLADRRRRRPLLIAADLVRAALLLTITLAALSGHLAFWQMFAVFGLVTGVSVLFDVADQAFLPDFVGRGRLEPANAALNAASAIGETGGPALMGTLVQALGGPLAIGVDALSYIASAVSLGMIRRKEPLPTVRPDAGSTLHEALQGARAVLGHPLLRPLALAIAMQSLGGGFFDALYEFYALKDLHLSPLAIGALIAAGGVGALLGAALAPRISRRLGSGPALIAGAVFYAALTLLVPFAPSTTIVAFLFLFAAQFFGDASSTLFGFGEAVLRQSSTPSAWLGRVTGAVRFFGNLVGAIGAGLAAAIAGSFGVRGSLLLASAFLFAAIPFLLAAPVRRQILPPPQDAAHFAT
ncbi:MAG: MFS transporter [Thermaerobacter sp.]|nr:MFS transporter [Thermaerobacter sp.]